MPPLVALAIDAATELGYRTERYDPTDRTLFVEGLGEVPLGPVIDRSEGLTEAQQRPKMRSAIARAVRNAPKPVAERHVGLAPELAGAVLRNQTVLQLNPGAPGPQQAIGRIERAAGIDGWEETIAGAGESYRRWVGEADTHLDGHRGAASMCRLLGEHEQARFHADQVVAGFDTAWREESYNPSLAVLADSLLLGGRRAELPPLAEREGQARLGPLWWPLCHAAGAAEQGDREAVARVLDDLRGLADEEALEWDGPGLAVRDLVEIVTGWVDQLD